ncbi:MAG: AbrB/MazE/SpoVT family DNA-binding domain-containing protein [Acidobacteria bacterium]|nr:AbrB/MazE/SpoVT family DNA-binding domain-containing protein [Acidobacteriota bacterium]MCB9399221.1 AbrB/MazE/SpoVT family DNA-binding domain-containing protein [Acidobacteriota bacterium]
MAQTAKLFINGRSQAVRLPAAFRFEGSEVFIRRDEETGDVILSKKPNDWAGFFAVLEKANLPNDFLDAHDRDQGEQARDPFSGWQE